MAMLGGVPVRAIRTGDTTPWQSEALEVGFKRAEKNRIEMAYTVGEDLDTIIAAARDMVAKGCQVIYLDYLQTIIVPRVESRREQMRVILSRFKRELNRPGVACAGIALSQFRKRENERVAPTRGDLYESNYIAQMAEAILLLWRDEETHLHMILDKAKDAQPGLELMLRRSSVSGMLEL